MGDVQKRRSVFCAPRQRWHGLWEHHWHERDLPGRHGGMQEWYSIRDQKQRLSCGVGGEREGNESQEGHESQEVHESHESHEDDEETGLCPMGRASENCLRLIIETAISDRKDK